MFFQKKRISIAGRRVALLSVSAVLFALATIKAQQAPENPGRTSKRLSGPTGPRYKGKPTSFWIKRLQNQDVAARKEAVIALATIGPGAEEAVAALLEALEDEDTAVREGAVKALGEIGPGAKRAANALIERLEDKDPIFHDLVLQALGSIGAEKDVVISALVKDLVNRKKVYKFPQYPGGALEAFRRLGRSAEAAVPDLQKALKDKDTDTETRGWIVSALSYIGPKAAPVLAEALGDEEHSIRQNAMNSLIRLGPEAGAALPGLQRVLRHKDQNIRVAAIQMLGMIGPEAIPALEKLLKDTDPVTRKTAIQSLGTLGPKAKATVPALLEAWKDPANHSDVVLALQRIGGPSAVPNLVKALKDKETFFRAMDALKAIGPDAKEAVPTLIDALKYDDATKRRYVIEILQAIGEPAVPALMATVKDKDNDQGYPALAALGPKAKGVVPDLIKLLKDSDPELRRRAAWLLGMLGGAAKEAVPALQEALGDRNSQVRREAKEALARLPRVR